MMALRVLSASLLTSALLISVGCSNLTQSSTAATDSAEQRLSSLAALSKQDPVTRTLDIQEWQTSAGTKVLFMAAPELPMFDLRLTFAAGSSKDQNHYGLANLTSAMLDEGTGALNAGQIAAQFEDLWRQLLQRLLPRYGGGQLTQPQRPQTQRPRIRAI